MQPGAHRHQPRVRRTVDDLREKAKQSQAKYRERQKQAAPLYAAAPAPPRTMPISCIPLFPAFPVVVNLGMWQIPPTMFSPHLATPLSHHPVALEEIANLYDLAMVDVSAPAHMEVATTVEASRTSARGVIAEDADASKAMEPSEEAVSTGVVPLVDGAGREHAGLHSASPSAPPAPLAHRTDEFEAGEAAEGLDYYAEPAGDGASKVDDEESFVEQADSMVCDEADDHSAAELKFDTPPRLSKENVCLLEQLMAEARLAVEALRTSSNTEPVGEAAAAEPVGEAAEKAAPEVVAEAHDPTSTLTAEGDGDGGGGFETRDVTLDRFQPRLQLLDGGSRLVATRHDGKPLYPSTEAAAAMAEVARFVEAEAEAEAAEAVRLVAAAAEVERLAVAAEAARLAAVVEEARVMMGHLAAGAIQEMLQQPMPAPTAIDWQAEMLKCIAEGKLPKTAKNLIPYSIVRSTAKMGMKDPIIFAATPQALGSLGVPSTLPDRRAALQILRTLGEYICLVDPAHVHKFQYHPGLYMSKRRCMSGSNKPQRANWFVIAESSVEAFKAAATHNKLDMMTIALSVAKMDKARRSAEPKSELAADEEVDSAGSKRAKLDGACANLDAEVEMQDVHAAALSEEISRLLQQLQAVEAKLLASEKAREAAELGIERGPLV